MAQTPTLFQWAGGAKAISSWMRVFYGRVPNDAVLAPVFAGTNTTAHASHVADFVGEVLGGPSAYSTDRGGHQAMVRRHLNRSLTERQRTRWIHLLLECADDAGLPTDPNFRSALVSYLEWGTRIAVINSQPGVPPPPEGSHLPMPHWGWGEVKGPWPPALAQHAKEAAAAAADEHKL